MYQQQNAMNRQQFGQQSQLQDQDHANFVLAELKRVAREYTTATLEASTPVVHQTFHSLLQKTLQDQSHIYGMISQASSYGEVKTASQQEVQQELQKQVQKTEQLQMLVQNGLQTANQQQGANSQAYQQQGAQQQNASFSQTNASPSFGGSSAASTYLPNYNQGSQGYGSASGQSYGQTASHQPQFTASAAQPTTMYAGSSQAQNQNHTVSTGSSYNAASSRPSTGSSYTSMSASSADQWNSSGNSASGEASSASHNTKYMF
ncbi:spore coat protein [Paenibacillus thalictri]|uniref:Spore coat protein n=1 Tax=Paenibacillus thalictri TaxID=2527873 RepID=A0A4Q9DKE2_9BACL|nr:spore coat protein [Paenibacillus thalictri]TBL73070.1 spore coat protein [Paenibacillus thalictri]